MYKICVNTNGILVDSFCFDTIGKKTIESEKGRLKTFLEGLLFKYLVNMRGKFNLPLVSGVPYQCSARSH